MRKLLFILLSGVFSVVFFGLNLQDLKAQENISFSTGSSRGLLDLTFGEPSFKNRQPRAKSSNIKDIQVFGEKSGSAFTDDALFRTDDNGETWRKIILPRQAHEFISGVYFANETLGYVVLADQENLTLQLVKTQDGGTNWIKTAINLRTEDLAEANLTEISIYYDPQKKIASIKLNLSSSSNFERYVFYKTDDQESFWERDFEEMKKRESEEKIETLDEYFKSSEKFFSEHVKIVGEVPSESIIKNFTSNPHAGFIVHSTWYLTQDGKCEGFKTGCFQTTKIYLHKTEYENQKAFLSVKEITPPEITELSRIEKERARLQAENSVFAQPPGGTTRISLNRGFDKCTAATAAQMQTWWNNSPFYDANIYISGRNRGCSQPQLTAAWVNTVSAQGWGLIPTIVGYQSPCSVSTNSVKHSTDAAIAEQQGRGEADIAITDANNLGLTQGTVLYYDMERYDDLSGTGACSTPTKAFLKGWTDRLKELGYISGVYGSPTNAVNDWLNIPQASRMDAVWLARWDNVPSVWFYASPSPTVPETAWGNHQRIKQWQAPHNETWGGVTFNIDGNIADGPVAGIAIAKNKRADFDGDGKSDISVWRPETGVWYIINSSNSSYTILNFGLSTDVLAPGDYDGDGKTDFAVWRPSDGVWHLYSRSIYRSFAFGADGDIPVPADYDGDGRTDAAVFRPSTGVWYIWNSSDSRGTSYTIVQFGLNGDKPVAGDYDGDGRADIAIFRPSSGEWWLNRSTAGVIAAAFGSSTDKPVPADFTGDGKTDIAYWRPATGEWFILRSEDASYFSVPFGQTGDVPAVGDFDGDNKSDIGVFRPDTGVWYVSQSQAGVLITQFGFAADRPVPTAYTP
jgi:hypothetical protein